MIDKDEAEIERPGSDSRLVEYYARRAAEYEQVYAKPERQADLRRLEKLLPAYFHGASLLEVACGTGYWTALLLRAAAAIVATDLSEETLRIAAQKSELRSDRVRFLVADAYALPEALGLFDAAFAGFWWSHVPRHRVGELLLSLHRRLRVGARVVLVDNRYVAGSSTPLALRDKEGNTYQRRSLADGSEHLVLKNFPARAELEEAVRGRAAEVEYGELDYYWWLAYRVGPLSP